MSTLRSPRPVAALVAGALVAITLAGPAQADRADDGASWLEGQLTDDIVVGGYLDDFTDPENPVWVETNDYGLTLDFGFGLKAIGGHRATVRGIRDAMAENVAGYTTGADFGAPGDRYAGAIAKLASYARTSGGDPRDFGGADLIRQLNARVADDRPIVGRIQDKSDFGDNANSIGQSFAARALALAGSRKAEEVMAFLLRQQCDRGYFRLNFAPASARRQGCDAAPTGSKAPDTDATALAVLNLRALPFEYRTAAVRGAIADATGWLRKRQKDNGSLGGGTSTEGSNANSTGLAAWVLGDAGICRPAARAARWVRDLQVVDADGTSLEGEDGAIAYDAAGYAEGEDGGISLNERDQWRRATAQAAPGLSYLRVADCS